MDRVLVLLREALQALLHAPQGQDDEHHDVLPRRVFVVRDEVLCAKHLAGSRREGTVQFDFRAACCED